MRLFPHGFYYYTGDQYRAGSLARGGVTRMIGIIPNHPLRQLNLLVLLHKNANGIRRNRYMSGAF